jgi:uncharacterized protein YbjT (DUF2867 family)
VRQCVADPRISEVLAVTRRALPNAARGVTEVRCGNFTDPQAIQEALLGVQVGFFCLGVSQSTEPNEERYRTITHTYAMTAARAISAASPTAVFHYVSGYGADPSGASRMMWARVKGEAERDILKLRPERTYVWRPGYVHAVAGREHRSPVDWVGFALYPLLRLIPGMVNTTVAVARAMLAATFSLPTQTKFGPKEIDRLAIAYDLSGRGS